MRTVRNITVSVTPEIYHQTRMLAAERDCTVSAIVAVLLLNLPYMLRRVNIARGGPKPAFGHPTLLSNSNPASTVSPSTTTQNETQFLAVKR